MGRYNLDAYHVRVCEISQLEKYPLLVPTGWQTSQRLTTI
jgi:hypothetical protein